MLGAGGAVQVPPCRCKALGTPHRMVPLALARGGGVKLPWYCQLEIPDSHPGIPYPQEGQGGIKH